MFSLKNKLQNLIDKTERAKRKSVEFTDKYDKLADMQKQQIKSEYTELKSQAKDIKKQYNEFHTQRKIERERVKKNNNAT